MASTAGQVARILYKEIVDGDIRKVRGESNYADSGGGARDFRFGSYTKLVGVIKQMFPDVVRENRKRDGQTAQIDVLKGEFVWRNPQGGLERKASFFEPPNDARPSEGRIARVPEYACFDTKLMPKRGPGNRPLVLLIQRIGEVAVWPHYVEEISLRQPGAWDPVVAEEMLRCLDAKRSANTAAVGFRDFINSQSYHNGK